LFRGRGQQAAAAEAQARARRKHSLEQTRASWRWAVNLGDAVDVRANNHAAAPFGMGPRACPAGSLSLVVAREVLEALLSRFEWSFVDPAQTRTEKWVQECISSPTLVIPSGLALTFQDIS